MSFALQSNNNNNKIEQTNNSDDLLPESMQWQRNNHVKKINQSVSEREKIPCNLNLLEDNIRNALAYPFHRQLTLISFFIVRSGIRYC